jgi:hypothetical protein
MDSTAGGAHADEFRRTGSAAVMSESFSFLPVMLIALAAVIVLASVPFLVRRSRRKRD